MKNGDGYMPSRIWKFCPCQVQFGAAGWAEFRYFEDALSFARKIKGVPWRILTLYHAPFWSSPKIQYFHPYGAPGHHLENAYIGAQGIVTLCQSKDWEGRADDEN